MHENDPLKTSLTAILCDKTWKVGRLGKTDTWNSERP